MVETMPACLPACLPAVQEGVLCLRDHDGQGIISSRLEVDGLSEMRLSGWAAPALCRLPQAWPEPGAAACQLPAG
jgi:hypothetical protein